MSLPRSKGEEEPKADAMIPPPGVGLLTVFAKDVLEAGEDGQKIAIAVRKNFRLSVGHNQHREDQRRLMPVVSK